MKHNFVRKSAAGAIAVLGFTGLTHAHPGRSAFDWFAAPPHRGHDHEISAALLTLAIVGVIWVGCRALARRG